MRFEIRDLMLTLSLAGEKCHGETGCQGQSGCPKQSGCPDQSGCPENSRFCTPSDKYAPARLNRPPGFAAGAAHVPALSALRQALRRTLSLPDAP